MVDTWKSNRLSTFMKVRDWSYKCFNSSADNETLVQVVWGMHGISVTGSLKIKTVVRIDHLTLLWGSKIKQMILWCPPKSSVVWFDFRSMLLLTWNVLERGWYFISQPSKTRMLGMNLYFPLNEAVLPSTSYWKEETKIMNSEPSRKGKDKGVKT